MSRDFEPIPAWVAFLITMVVCLACFLALTSGCQALLPQAEPESFAPLIANRLAVEVVKQPVVVTPPDSTVRQESASWCPRGNTLPCWPDDTCDCDFCRRAPAAVEAERTLQPQPPVRRATVILDGPQAQQPGPAVNRQPPPQRQRLFSGRKRQPLRRLFGRR